MKEKLALLKEIGLSEGEIKVYSAILESGIAKVNRIHEKTGIERRNIYDILNKLIDKGLVTYAIEQGKRTYQCAHPNKIAEEISEREKSLEALREEIPKITSIYEHAKPEIRVEIYRGNEGMNAIFEDMLNYKENFFIGGSELGVHQRMPLFWERWNERRIKKKVKWYDILDYNAFFGIFKKDRRKLKKLKEQKYYEYRILPKDFQSPHVVFIYGDKTANVLWGEKSFAFVMENKEITDSYKRYHAYLWKRLKPGPSPSA